MSSTRVLVLILAAVWGSLPAAAQTPPKPGPAESAPSKAPAQTQSEPDPDEGGADEGKPAAGKAAVAGKRAACRDDARAKKLRGMERLDSMQLCLAEARVACVKEAIAKKMPKQDRKPFFKTCME